MTEFQPPPEPIPDYVTACLEYVRRALKVDLDFTPAPPPAESLPDAQPRKPSASTRPAMLMVPELTIEAGVGPAAGFLVRSS